MNLLIGGQKIEKVSCCKYLGLFMDERLLFDEHINYVYKKLAKFSSIFYKVRYLLPYACLKKLYFAFVYPHILFEIEIYANTSKSRLDKLAKLNNKIIRILLNKKVNTPVIMLFKIINVLPINELYAMQLLMFVHKCIYHKELIPEVFHNYYISMQSVHCYSNRRNTDLYMMRVKSSLGQRCSVFKGSKLWNLLPADLKTYSSVFVFKKNLKNHLLNVTN